MAWDKSCVQNQGQKRERLTAKRAKSDFCMNVYANKRWKWRALVSQHFCIHFSIFWHFSWVTWSHCSVGMVCLEVIIDVWMQDNSLNSESWLGFNSGRKKPQVTWTTPKLNVQSMRWHGYRVRPHSGIMYVLLALSTVDANAKANLALNGFRLAPPSHSLTPMAAHNFPHPIA